MPRDGYTSLTVQNETVEELDRRAGDDEGPVDVIRRLLDETAGREVPRGEARPVGSPQVDEVLDRLDELERTLRRTEELADRAPERTADLLESRFGPRR